MADRHTHNLRALVLQMPGLKPASLPQEINGVAGSLVQRLACDGVIPMS